MPIVVSREAHISCNATIQAHHPSSMLTETKQMSAIDIVIARWEALAGSELLLLLLMLLLCGILLISVVQCDQHFRIFSAWMYINTYIYIYVYLSYMYIYIYTYKSRCCHFAVGVLHFMSIICSSWFVELKYGSRHYSLLFVLVDSLTWHPLCESRDSS